jgi:hypothetical protein
LEGEPLILSKNPGELNMLSRIYHQAGDENVAAASVKPHLMAITRVKCVKGQGRFDDAQPGYQIQWKGVPYGAKVELCVHRSDVAIPVTMGFRRLELWYLLEALRYLGLYGVEVQVWIRVPVYGGGYAESNRRTLRAPVRPFLAPLTIAQIRAESGQLRYLELEAGQTDPDTGRTAANHEFAGRLLSSIMDGYRYQVQGGYLTTHSNFRGFDCITFGAAMVGVYMALPDGKALANGIACEPCGLENVSRSQIIRKCMPGEILSYHYQQFIAFHERHNVLIGGGKVFEFSASRKGFHENHIHLWEGWAKAGAWTIRRIPEKYRFRIE